MHLWELIFLPLFAMGMEKAHEKPFFASNLPAATQKISSRGFLYQIQQAASQNDFKTYFDLINTLAPKERTLSPILHIKSHLYPPEQDTALHWAVRQCNLAALQEFTKNCAAVDVVNRKGQTPLHLAAEYGNLEMIIHLVRSRAQCKVTDCFRRTPLHCHLCRI